MPWLVSHYPGYRFVSSVHWLSWKRGRPRCIGNRMKYFSRLEKKQQLFQYRLSAIGLIVLQLLSYLSFGLWLLLTSLPTLFVIAFGMILNDLKLLSVNKLFNQYFLLLVGNSEFEKDCTSEFIDETLLEEFDDDKLFTKTIPLLVLQSTNSMLIGETDTASLVGMSWSIYIVAKALWKWVYYEIFLGVSYRYVKSSRKINQLSRQERKKFEFTQKVVQFSYLKKIDICYDNLCEAWNLLQNSKRFKPNLNGFVIALNLHEPLDLLGLDLTELYWIARFAADAGGAEDLFVFSFLTLSVLTSQKSGQLRLAQRTKYLENLQKYFLYRMYEDITNRLSELLNDALENDEYLQTLILETLFSFLSLIGLCIRVTPLETEVPGQISPAKSLFNAASCLNCFSGIIFYLQVLYSHCISHCISNA